MNDAQGQEDSLAKLAISIEEEAASRKDGSYSIILYLVRHGETEANNRKIVVGQGDSRLTKLGVAQITALSKSLMEMKFDKLVTSDLGRTVETANLLLKPGVRPFTLEKRLREMAKGAREGLAKALTYEQAIEQRKRWTSAQHEANQKGTIPLIESDNDVWDRLRSWLVDLVKDVTAEMKADAQQRSSSSAAYHVLAVTHAGVIRSLCRQLVPEEMPQSIDLSDMGRDGSTSNHLNVPNSSVTVLEILVPKSLRLASSPTTTVSLSELKTHLKVLTWQKHLTAFLETVHDSK